LANSQEKIESSSQGMNGDTVLFPDNSNTKWDFGYFKKTLQGQGINLGSDQKNYASAVKLEISESIIGHDSCPDSTNYKRRYKNPFKESFNACISLPEDLWNLYGGLLKRRQTQKQKLRDLRNRKRNVRKTKIRFKLKRAQFRKTRLDHTNKCKKLEIELRKKQKLAEKIHRRKLRRIRSRIFGLKAKRKWMRKNWILMKDKIEKKKESVSLIHLKILKKLTKYQTEVSKRKLECQTKSNIFRLHFQEIKKKKIKAERLTVRLKARQVDLIKSCADKNLQVEAFRKMKAAEE
jgi:hypothetical protein